MKFYQKLRQLQSDNNNNNKNHRNQWPLKKLNRFHWTSNAPKTIGETYEICVDDDKVESWMSKTFPHNVFTIRVTDFVHPLCALFVEILFSSSITMAYVWACCLQTGCFATGGQYFNLAIITFRRNQLRTNEKNTHSNNKESISHDELL